MGATIDDKVVAMSFDSKKFESGVDDTISAIDKLKKALHFPGAGKGLEDIGKAAGNLDLSRIGSGVDVIKGKFSAMSIVAISALANIATRAVDAGIRVIKAFTLTPIMDGFHNYETQINAVQTILANTGLKGKQGLAQVNSALADLNKYANLTVYNFSEMAKNIGTFTAAGVDLKTSTASIKGIANLAALSGSNSQQASTAMYQLSQAIAANSTKLQDWNSVVNAGMGGKVFQKALFNTGQALHTLKSAKMGETFKQWTDAGNTFRLSLKDGWVTGKVLTQTLQNFTGDLTNAQLKSMGYTDAQIANIQKLAKVAVGAATNIKTFTQLTQALKEEVATAYAAIFKTLFGNINQATKMFSAIHIVVENGLTLPIYALNKVLEQWAKLGGRTVFLDAMKEGFKSLAAVANVVKAAFRDIFPVTTGKNLYDATVNFKKFMDQLKPSAKTLENLRRTFRGVFAVLDIGKQVIVGALQMFEKLFHSVSSGRGGLLNFTGNIGDFLVSLDKALKKGGQITHFFDGLATVLQKPIDFLKRIAGAIANLFSGFSPGGFSSKMDTMTKAMTPFERIMTAIHIGWGKFVDKFDGSDAILKKVFDSIVTGIQGFSSTLAKAVSGINFEAVLQVIRTGLFAGIFLMLKKFLGKGSLTEQLAETGGGFIKNISGSLDALRGSMVAIQQNIKADTLKKIALSVTLLAAGVTALSLVDPTKLKGALAAMTVAFGELLGSMKILTVISGTTGFLKIPAIAAGLVVLGAAIDTISVAVIAMSFLSWDSLIKGLAGVGALLGGISAAAIPLSKNGPGLISAGVGITAMGIGLNFLAHAVKTLGSLDLKSLAKGLGAVGASLVIMIATLEEMPAANMIAIGTGLIGIGIGMRILAGAVAKFAEMNLKDIVKGLAPIGGALVIIAGAMELMPEGMFTTAAGLAVVAFSLSKIAKAVVSLSGLSWIEMARGLTALAGSLAILAGALLLMQDTVGGAAALGVAALALKVLASALKTLSGMSWGEIAKGLGAVAASIGLLAAAGLLLTEAIPAMLGLGIAMLALGAGIALIGGGVALLGIGLGAIATAGAAAVGVLVQAVLDITKAIPEMGTNLILGMLTIVQKLAEVAPKFVDALAKIINSLVDLVIREAPKIATAFIAVIDAILQILNERQDAVIQAGIGLLVALLKGIRNNIGQIVVVVASIITTLINALASNIGKIINAGANLLVSLLRGIASQLGKIVSAANDIIVKIVQALVGGYGQILSAAVGIVTKFIGGLASQVSNLIAAGTKFIVHLITGIASAGERIASAGTNAMIRFMNAVVKESLKLGNAGGQAIVNLLNGIAKAIDKYEPQIIIASTRIGVAIVTGMLKGLAGSTHLIYDKAKEIGDKALDIIKHPWKLASPSKTMVDVGQNIILGLVQGLDSNAKDVYSSAEAVSLGMISAVKSILQITSPSKVFYQIGTFINQGLANGLTGSQSDINDAWKKTSDMLLEAMKQARKDIGVEQDKLTGLMADKTPDLVAIRKAQLALLQDQDILKKSTDARNTLLITLQTQKGELEVLSAHYDNLSNKLVKAQQALADAEQTRKDAIKGFTDQYSTLPDIVTTDAEGNAVDQLATYENALKNQADSVAAYQQTLDALRKLGLDDATYQKLLSEGPADQQFATQLLSGGKTAVTGLNTLDKQLKTNAELLAKHAGDNLYKAGIAAAQGLIDSLKSKKREIYNTMYSIAEEMIKAINDKLKSHSPSQEMFDIGGYAMEGLALGLADSSKVVIDAVEGVGSDALTAMQKSMSDISDIAMGSIDANPTITPILDLTQIKNQSGELASLTDVSPITAAASYKQASAISSQQTAASTETLDAAVAGPNVQFIQTNNSPKSLSEVEIYRQTKNQLSQFGSAFVGGA